MGKIDRAAHSSGGRRTARTEILYGPGGGVYIYLIYGMYACLNIVCNRPEIPEAALIRAVEPVRGLDGLCQARFGCTARELIEGKGSRAIVQLTNGPGKLCKALRLTKEDSRLDVFHSFFHMLEEKPPVSFQRVETTRIGVDYAGEDALLPYRYYIEGNPFVSKP
ncbi:MAG: DNA-3-methyladenine glycosylase [Clostridiales bacterium]|nr:DNA-3-methyladenine glycosylase [Clostridiales bacterium]